MTQHQPNILMIQADQMSALALGCYGHPLARTPHIDRLAEQGVLFTNMYCNSPLCGPSRSSMVAGRHPHRIGCYDNANELPAAVPTFMHLLRSVNYELWMSGKMHFVGPDQLHGLHGRMNTDIYPSNFDWTADWTRGTYGNPGTSVRYLHHSGPCSASLQLDYDEETTSLGLRALRDLTRSSGRSGNPFFLCVSLTHPHDPYHITPEFWDLYRHDEVPPPSVPATPMGDLHPFNQWLQIHHEVDRYPPSRETVQMTRHAYLAMVSYVDAKVGELLAELKRLGIEKDTVVLFTSDHGDMQGEHGMWFKRTFYEDSMRVPLIFSAPGIIRENVRVDTPVSLVDLFPTLTALGEAPDEWPGREDLDGNNLAPFLRGDAPGKLKPMLAEYLGEGVLEPMRMTRNERYKYVHVAHHEPLLFDLQADPGETNNLSGDPALQAVERTLRDAVLQDWNDDAVKTTVMRNQQQRLLLKDALNKGQPFSWDYQPWFDAARQWVRQYSTQETKRMNRWPYVGD
jgi:choline-sulfatase